MRKRMPMRKARVLLTGFEPFDGALFNISEKLVYEIKKIDLGNIELDSKILSVDESGTKYVSGEIMNKQYDCILQLGFSKKAKKINLESKAENKINMNIKDNSGRMIRNESIIDYETTHLRTTTPLEGLSENIPEDILISEDAGTFVCNETYYRTLNTIYESNLLDRFGRVLPCIFIHLPSEDYVPISKQIEFILSVIEHINNKKIIDVVAAIIHNQYREILVAKRDSNQPHPGKWEFPGGKLNSHETEEEGLKREIFEELNLNIDITSTCGEITHCYEEHFVKLKAMNAKITPTSPPLELIVHDEVLWISIEKLSTLDWLEANFKLVNILQNQS